METKRAQEFIEERSGGLYVAGTRVSLASVVVPFKNGASPETILQSFPALMSLANVYGAIAFYLSNQDGVERFLVAQDQKWEEFRQMADPMPAGLASRTERKSF